MLATIQRHPVVGGGGPVVGGTKQWPHMSHFAVALHMVQLIYSGGHINHNCHSGVDKPGRRWLTGVLRRETKRVIINQHTYP